MTSFTSAPLIIALLARKSATYFWEREVSESRAGACNSNKWESGSKSDYF